MIGKPDAIIINNNSNEIEGIVELKTNKYFKDKSWKDIKEKLLLRPFIYNFHMKIIKRKNIDKK